MPVIEIKELASCKKELLIEVSQELFDDEVDKACSKLGKEISVPGFRKGKIPKYIIKSKYGAKIEEDAINKTIPKAYGEAIKEVDLIPIGNPVIGKVEAEKENLIRFSATIEHLPNFEIKRYSEFDFTWEIVKVTDEEISKEIANIQETFSELESVSGRAIEKGNYAIIDYKGTIDDESSEEMNEKGVQICIGEGRFLPELEAGIIGMSLGDHKEIVVAFPKDYHGKNLAGKKAVFKVILNEIKIKNLPELDDRFVKEHSNEENLEALRSSIEKRLKKEEEEEGKIALKEKIFIKLHEANHFEFPDSLVDSQARMMAYNGMRRMGFTDEIIQKEQERFLKFQEAVLPVARTSVITQLIMEKIKALKNFDVTEDELSEALKKVPDHSSQTASGIATSQNASTENNEKAHREYMQSKIYNNKVLDFLISKNRVEKVYIDRPKNISDNESVKRTLPA